MRISVRGFDGPVARATREELARRGHEIANSGADCAIFFPGPLEELERLAEPGSCRRLVIRSHAYAYGSNTRNPGMMTEERVSLLPPGALERRWLRAEAIAARHPNSAAVRLTNVLAPEEGDAVVRQVASRVGVRPAGHDPNVQFITVADAARALAAAAESNATGLFNAAGQGAIPLKKALRAAARLRLPVPGPLARLDPLEYNWTVSSERAAQELGFRAERSSVEALREFLETQPGARPGLLRASYDDWGVDVDYIRAWGWWFRFLEKVYWRIECEGMEHVPETGRAMYVANHRGFMPLDGVMHLWLMFTRRRRVPRFLIVHTLLRIPFLCDFLTKLGGVVASQENARRLFDAGEVVGMFPEGIRGAFTPYKTAYQLRDFNKSGFAKMAIANRAPVIPVAVVGHAEIFPIIARIDSSLTTRILGWPYFPIAPMFPLAPVPIPSKWHVRVLPAVPTAGLGPRDAGEFGRYIQEIIQRNLDDMVPRRKRVFWGRVLDGTAPAHPPFAVAAPRMAGGGR